MGRAPTVQPQSKQEHMNLVFRTCLNATKSQDFVKQLEKLLQVQSLMLPGNQIVHIGSEVVDMQLALGTVFRHNNGSETYRPWKMSEKALLCWHPPTGVNPEDGDRLLHAAIKSNSQPVVHALLKAGASIVVKNSAGKTPLDTSVEYGREQMLIDATKDMNYNPAREASDSKSLWSIDENVHALAITNAAG